MSEQDDTAGTPNVRGHPKPEVYWRTRRRVTLVSLFNLTATQVWIYLNPGATNAQTDVLISLSWVFGAIIGAYMGFKMVEKGFGKR